MADQTASSMHQRRHLDAPGAGYGHHQQQYYQQYMPAYNNYQYAGVLPYNQQMPPQQWHHYQQNYSQHRSQPGYPPMSPYSYPHHGNYQARPMPQHMHQPYAAARPPPDTPTQQGNGMPPPSYPDVPVHMELSPSPPAPVEFSGHRAPYYPPLPWLSVADQPFPPRQPRSRRRPRAQSASQPVELPNRSRPKEKRTTDKSQEQVIEKPDSQPTPERGESTVLASPEQTAVSAVSQLQSEVTAASTATSVATQPQRTHEPQAETQAPYHGQKASVVVPAIPTLPLPSISSPEQGKASSPVAPTADAVDAEQSSAVQSVAPTGAGYPSASVPEPTRAPPKSWAELLRSRGGAAGSAPAAANASSTRVSDSVPKRTDALGQAIASFAIQKPNPEYKLSFLEPRGLINSGNMCYMNSVLVFCVPFYNFLGNVSKQAVYSFKSDTPLLDAMIMFMREFIVIDAADSLDKLRLRLKPKELEQFGEPLLPEYVYEEIRRMPRFATMQRGHQQDAEEFLGFLFEELQGECARAIRNSGLPLTNTSDVASKGLTEKTEEDGWLEVGPKQKASTTRSSGAIEVDTPINRIFGGQLRSELRVPGVKNSVTLEPYQSLQLDIGSPEIRTITDALKGLTKPETLHGDFQSPRGAGVNATKQVFVESLPPVLILHLKRFQYDNTGGTQKIWKKIGYPLELEIPKEAFPHARRGSLAVRGGLPKYRLISVIYHHGKSATAGHYTTDILRQDEREWLRVDDTYIRRVRSQDVEGGTEEDPKVLAAALEQHRHDEYAASGNIEESMTEDTEGPPSDKGWSQAKAGGKKWSGIVNGTAKSSGRATPVGPQSLKDNKVAYILFYEKIET